MSRAYGRINEVYNVTKELNESNFRKYKVDRGVCSWKEIEDAPDKIEIYLPDIAIEYLSSKKIQIMKTPFLKYTLTQIPTTDDEIRFIKFPSLVPKEEFKRELLFYVGMVLSYYEKDKPNDYYLIPDEYDDILPYLLEYLYLKTVNKADKFDIKHLNEVRNFQKGFNKYYKEYRKFEELADSARYSSIDRDKYAKFQELCKEREEEMASQIKDSIVQLSAYEGFLGIIETITSESDIKELIEKLMINKDGNRSITLNEYGINSYGYKRLSKKIAEYNR